MPRPMRYKGCAGNLGAPSSPALYSDFSPHGLRYLHRKTHIGDVKQEPVPVCNRRERVLLDIRTGAFWRAASYTLGAFFFNLKHALWGEEH